MIQYPLKFSQTTFCQQYHRYEIQNQGSSMRCTVDGLVLWKILKSQPILTALEIGTYEGLTAGLLLETCPGVDLTVVDMQRRYKLFDQLYSNFSGQLTFIEKISEDVHLDKKFDLILIDANHSYEGVTKDIKNFAGLLRDRHSFLIFDDYNMPEVRQAIDDARRTTLATWVPFLQTPQLEFWHHESIDRQDLLNTFWSDPIKEFLFISMNRDPYENILLKIGTVPVFTSKIDFFRSVLDLYDL